LCRDTGNRRERSILAYANGCADRPRGGRHKRADCGAKKCARSEMIDRLVLASSNSGKLREFRRLLAPLGIEIVAQTELGIADADEPHSTFVENALAKARHASASAKLPALADDSGICVQALAGAPGVASARY